MKEKDIEIEIGNKDELKAAGDSVIKSRSRSLLGLNDQHEQCRAAALINLRNEEEVVVGEARYIRTSEGVLLERGSTLRVGAKARRMFLYAAALLRYIPCNTAECGQSACLMSACLSCCSSCQATEICLCVCLHSSRTVLAVQCSAVQCSAVWAAVERTIQVIISYYRS